MHEWHTVKSTDIQSLIDEFSGFEFETDYRGRDSVTNIRITNRMFTDETSTRDFVTRSSYGGSTAYIAAFNTGKISKAYQEAFKQFLDKREDYVKFKDSLTIAFGRKSSKVTCPNCESSINLKYGNRYRACPVCGSKKIISDSNWKILDTKRRLSEKASENLKVQAEKCGIMFMAGIEWHC